MQGDITTGSCNLFEKHPFQVLQIHLSKVDDNKCRTLVRYLLEHPSLKVLDLSHNQIGDRGARALGKLMGSSQLETLTLYDNCIGDPGAKALSHALSKNPRLLSLNLALNRLQDDGGEALVNSLLKNSFLLHINLAANELTVQTAQTLHKVLLRNSSLKSINLSGNNLDVVSLPHMSKQKTYKRWVLNGGFDFILFVFIDWRVVTDNTSLCIYIKCVRNWESNWFRQPDVAKVFTFYM